MEGLCWTAYAGYVDPARAAELQPLLDAYGDAGCTIGYCPSPAPHIASCREDSGSYVCG